MSSYVLTSLAKADIFHIWSYIAADNVRAADRVEQAIFSACELVSESPSCGHSRHDLTSRPLLFWTIPRYPNFTLVYRPESSPIQVVAVLHGKRNMRRALRQRQQPKRPE
ncbi:MAG TPA: type II toxin-antitoxin system RelE/ParE family toxin [Terracidiphilus sp.]|jgi:plasmid stabilization system protein ParE